MDDPERDKMTWGKMRDLIKNELADLDKDETFYGVSDADFEAVFKRKARARKALRNCVYGFEQDKTIVKGFIKNIIRSVCVTEEELCEILDFHQPFLEPRIKMEIILYYYMNEFGKDALLKLIKEYDLDRLRYEIEDKTQGSYLILSEDINSIYAEKSYSLDFNSMLDILTTLFYQEIKGFGIIDTIRDMNINGINCGTSGSVLSSILSSGEDTFTAPRSVWLGFEGKFIHLRFLTFGSEEELRRIIQLIGRFGKSQPLTEKVGYKVSRMYDKSRVLSIRPPSSEYWCVFIRKFTLPRTDLMYLLSPKDRRTGENLVKNPELPIQLISYLMGGQVTMVFTGMQYTGKTTQMIGSIKYVDPCLNIRTIEMVFELYLREIYPERNILGVQETEYILAQELQDALKKSDGGLTIIGEIATDVICSRFIQGTQISSPFSIASHHGITTKGMLEGMGNSHSAASGIPSQIALQQVIDAVPMNAHLARRYDGVRYYEHFTEIIPVTFDKKFPEVDATNLITAIASHAKIQRELAIRQTQKTPYVLNRILKFDVEAGLYVPDNWFSPARTQHILDKLPDDSKRESFLRFAEEYWGKDKYKYAKGA